MSRLPRLALAKNTLAVAMSGSCLRSHVKRVFLKIHKLALRLGLIILPNHYYAGIPDLNELKATLELWARKSGMVGVNCDIEGQVTRLKQICAPFELEYRSNSTYLEACRSGSGPGFGYIEAQALHAVVRHFKPTRVVEVDSGVSTRCILAAAKLNRAETGRECHLMCIEPFPRAWLRTAPVELIAKPVQAVPFHFFSELLEPGSLLFIDSSHTVRTGGDVNHLVLEVLPRLEPGVVVHFHDIYLPYDYPRDALATLSQAQETALLHAFLIGNRSVRILFSLGWLHYERRDVLCEVFPEYRPQRDWAGLQDESYPPFGDINEHFPSSTYLETTA